MRIHSISLLFVVQVWNIEFYQCLELVQITLPVIEITHYQGDYTTSYYIYIVTTPVVQQYNATTGKISDISIVAGSAQVNYKVLQRCNCPGLG
jgi:hypothetical protein